MSQLLLFDKLNLAHCAALRAQANTSNAECFTGEYETAGLWKAHKVIQFVVDGRPMGFVSVF